ncbi:UV DNA damage repair endonuclease UvsE [Bacillus lacus]|uniref:UV DNA damage repair endonuclease UvsE n=1 Tax=Metabacillus lacus TaxID=1983721 RepID=A0A7X2LZM0_9BACI|nr:UV DNA damage repair endonuclease UvsE [Metabacillus lacus]MRX72097.1 UV DNA damage repair endonuclease UvsE [Metabacillus lacus]
MRVRMGYVAMSMQLQNCSPSQTMTYAQFSKIKDRDAAIKKLERIARSNLENCLRLLKHNAGNDIHFFRLSSKLIPLANHPELSEWRYMNELREPLNSIADFIGKHEMRVDFHPDHFVVLNSKEPDILNMSLKTLHMHEALLRGMNIPAEHRCVMHIGGAYEDKEKALEQFIHNWGLIPVKYQKLVMLENDDTTFHLKDTLYLCEKLGIPLVFDYHHHLAYHEERDWEEDWIRILSTWEASPLPVKMHISSPRSEKEYRAHADKVNVQMFLEFLHAVKDSTDRIDCMIEAKMKDEALFTLMEELSGFPEIIILDGSTFEIV